MSYLCVIPARKGSKGVKHKNIRLLGGKPLIEWTFSLANTLDPPIGIVCTTDFPDVMRIADKYSIPTVLRDPTLATDGAKIIDVLNDILSRNIFPDISHIVLLQPTSPFTSPSTIDKCIKLSVERPDDTIICCFNNTHLHPSLIFRASSKSHRCAEWLCQNELTVRRQELSTYMIRCGCCYVIPKHTLQAGNLYSHNTSYVEVSQIEAHNIDTELDFLIAQSILDQDGSIR